MKQEIFFNGKTSLQILVKIRTFSLSWKNAVLFVPKNNKKQTFIFLVLVIIVQKL